MSHLRQFHKIGFQLVRGVFTDEELRPLVHEYSQALDKIAVWLFRRRRIKRLYRWEPFNRRAAMIAAEYPRILTDLDIRKILGPVTFSVITHRRLAELAEAAIGRPVMINPIFNLRGILPGHQGQVWHQDAIAMVNAPATRLVTCWIALTRATRRNSCLQLLPKARGLLLHYGSRNGKVSKDLDTSRAITLQAKRGDVVMMDKFTPHGSTPNKTRSIRWSLDIRYHVGQRSGRNYHPSFPVRKIDYATWKQTWQHIWST